MLELPVQDVHLPELHLPELHLPELHVPQSVANFEWPTVDLSSIDVGKAVAGAAAAVHIGRRRSRRRWPLAVGGLLAAGMAGWVVLGNEAARARIAGAVGAIRERIAAARWNRHGELEMDADDPIAFPAAETALIEATEFDYPAGLGSNNGDGTSVLVGANSPG
jgi:hypothetical protein